MHEKCVAKQRKIAIPDITHDQNNTSRLK